MVAAAQQYDVPYQDLQEPAPLDSYPTDTDVVEMLNWSRDAVAAEERQIWHEIPRSELGTWEQTLLRRLDGAAQVHNRTVHVLETSDVNHAPRAVVFRPALPHRSSLFEADCVWRALTYAASQFGIPWRDIADPPDPDAESDNEGAPSTSGVAIGFNEAVATASLDDLPDTASLDGTELALPDNIWTEAAYTILIERIQCIEGASIVVQRTPDDSWWGVSVVPSRGQERLLALGHNRYELVARVATSYGVSVDELRVPSTVNWDDAVAVLQLFQRISAAHPQTTIKTVAVAGRPWWVRAHVRRPCALSRGALRPGRGR
jgi:hypothetical protein